MAGAPSVRPSAETLADRCIVPDAGGGREGRRCVLLSHIIQNRPERFSHKSKTALHVNQSCTWLALMGHSPWLNRGNAQVVVRTGSTVRCEGMAREIPPQRRGWPGRTCRSSFPSRNGGVTGLVFTPWKPEGGSFRGDQRARRQQKRCELLRFWIIECIRPRAPGAKCDKKK